VLLRPYLERSYVSNRSLNVVGGCHRAEDATGVAVADVAEFSLTELGAHVEVLPSADVALSAKLTAIQATDLRCGLLL